MYDKLRRVLVLLLVLATATTFASSGGGWQQPTAQELSMKSYPADPNAPAVYLDREEVVDDSNHMHSVYARIKILTEKGKEMFSEIRLPPYVTSMDKISDVAGRTILSSGAVIPYSGKPYDKLLVKAGGFRVIEKVFALPDVQVGSILEFRYRLSYGGGWDLPPSWRIQHTIPILKASYKFVPDKSEYRLAYSYHLPPGDKIVREKKGTFDLNVADIPALPKEDYLPPIGNFTDRLDFYYSFYKSGKEFWQDQGDMWSQGFDKFAHVSGNIRKAVKGIVSPGDSDEQKAEKIYAAMMKIENTDFTRASTTAEDKAEHLKFKYAQDIWAQKRGGSDQITGLFIALARAAGLKAYAAIVVDRDEHLFNQNILSWDQMDDDLAIVVINGKEVYLDPGQRYCEFGHLNWKHSWTSGIRETDHKTEIFATPGQSYLENSTQRIAQLTLSPNGQVQGVVDVSMKGAPALYWRQDALNSDQDALKKEFEDNLQKSMPQGVVVKTNHFVGLTDPEHYLMAIVDVSGTLGTQTGKYTFLPAAFFEAGDSPLFSETSRKYPVDMHYPFTHRDEFTLALPSGLKIDSIPQGGETPLEKNADYVTKFVSAPGAYEYGRLLIVANPLYTTQEYPALRSFFQKVSANDHSQVALKATAIKAATLSTTK